MHVDFTYDPSICYELRVIVLTAFVYQGSLYTITLAKRLYSIEQKG